MNQRPQTWPECWRYARTIGYPRTLRGVMRAYRDLVHAAYLPWGVRRTPINELYEELVN